MCDVSNCLFQVNEKLCVPMLDHLPLEIQTHLHVLSNDLLFRDMTPRYPGATENPFFCHNNEKPVNPSVEVRPIGVPIPQELRVVYERYSDDTEFTTPQGWTFLSEREIMTRMMAMQEEGQTRFVDIAISYAGMGHVHVLSYLQNMDCVFTSIDGGANGWDREANHALRMTLSTEDVSTVPFQTWWTAIREDKQVEN